MLEEKIYRIRIRGKLVVVNKELYLFFYRSRRRLDYYEHDIKTEIAIRDKNGKIIGYMPSKEDSFDRIIESGADFRDNSEGIEDLVIATPSRHWKVSEGVLLSPYSLTNTGQAPVITTAQIH